MIRDSTGKEVRLVTPKGGSIIDQALELVGERLQNGAALDSSLSAGLGLMQKILGSSEHVAAICFSVLVDKLLTVDFDVSGSPAVQRDPLLAYLQSHADYIGGGGVKETVHCAACGKVVVV